MIGATCGTRGWKGLYRMCGRRLGSVAEGVGRADEEDGEGGKGR